jgi:hypothetical protein
MVHIAQSRPDSGLDFVVKAFKPFYGDPSSHGSGSHPDLFMINTRAQLITLHAWIMFIIVKHHLVQIDRIDGPTEYLS